VWLKDSKIFISSDVSTGGVSFLGDKGVWDKQIVLKISRYVEMSFFKAFALRGGVFNLRDKIEFILPGEGLFWKRLS
jgi:hypothetical protein